MDRVGRAFQCARELRGLRPNLVGNFSLNGKVAILTGGASEIGEAIAAVSAKRDAKSQCWIFDLPVTARRTSFAATSRLVSSGQEVAQNSWRS